MISTYFLFALFLKTSEIKIFVLEKRGATDIQTQRNQTWFYRECLSFRSLCNATKGNPTIRSVLFSLHSCSMIVAFVEHAIWAESANYFECTFPIGSPGLKSVPAFLVALATRRDHQMPRLIGTLSERWGTYTKDNSRSRIEHGAYYRVVSPSWCVENPGMVGGWRTGRGEMSEERFRRRIWNSETATAKPTTMWSFVSSESWLVVWYRSCSPPLYKSVNCLETNLKGYNRYIPISDLSLYSFLSYGGSTRFSIIWT